MGNLVYLARLFYLCGHANATRVELETNLRALATLPDPELLAGVKAILDPVRDWTWACGNWKG